MSRFEVDSDGELVREGGAFVRCSGTTEAKINAQERTRMIKGEAPFDRRAGLPWLPTGEDDEPLLTKKGIATQALESLIAAQIETLPGMSEIEVVLTQTPAQRTNREGSVAWRGKWSRDEAAADLLISDTVTLRP